MTFSAIIDWSIDADAFAALDEAVAEVVSDPDDDDDPEGDGGADEDEERSVDSEADSNVASSYSSLGGEPPPRKFFNLPNIPVSMQKSAE